MSTAPAIPASLAAPSQIAGSPRVLHSAYPSPAFRLPYMFGPSLVDGPSDFLSNGVVSFGLGIDMHTNGNKDRCTVRTLPRAVGDVPLLSRHINTPAPPKDSPFQSFQAFMSTPRLLSVISPYLPSLFLPAPNLATPDMAAPCADINMYELAVSSQTPTLGVNTFDLFPAGFLPYAVDEDDRRNFDEIPNTVDAISDCLDACDQTAGREECQESKAGGVPAQVSGGKFLRWLFGEECLNDTPVGVPQRTIDIRDSTPAVTVPVKTEPPVASPDLKNLDIWVETPAPSGELSLPSSNDIRIPLANQATKRKRMLPSYSLNDGTVPNVKVRRAATKSDGSKRPQSRASSTMGDIRIWSPVLNAHAGVEPAALIRMAEKYKRRTLGLDDAASTSGVHVEFDKAWLLQFAGKLSAQGEMVEDFRCYLSGCNQVNKRRDHILVHVGSHVDQRPFPCGFCNLRFLRKNEWKRHEASHTGDRPHSCGLCSSQFSRVDLLKRHLTRTHGMDDEPDCDAKDEEEEGAPALKRLRRA